MKVFLSLSLAAMFAAVSGEPASAVTLFGPGDDIIAIDTDVLFNSSYPGGEPPTGALDQSTATKYLNFGGAGNPTGTGLIVTPGFGSSIAKSLLLTTANDAPDRDPLTYDLYGTNDAIASADNSPGAGESWSLISSGLSGLLDLEDGATERNTAGVIQDFGGNTDAYSSYKLIFSSLRDPGPCCMQVADIALYTDVAGGGSQVLSGTDFAIAVTDDPTFGSASNYPGGEAPSFGIDGDTGTKYLNFADTNSGFIVSRADGKPTIAESLTFTTGNDAENRDPVKYDLYGTNDTVTSADNGLGDDENWTLLVDGGDTGLLPLTGRGETGAAQATGNTEAYGAYRIVFTELRNINEGIMQVAEINFQGTVVPEPTSAVLVALGCFGLASRRRSA